MVCRDRHSLQKTPRAGDRAGGVVNRETRMYSFTCGHPPEG